MAGSAHGKHIWGSGAASGTQVSCHSMSERRPRCVGESCGEQIDRGALQVQEAQIQAPLVPEPPRVLSAGPDSGPESPEEGY